MPLLPDRCRDLLWGLLDPWLFLALSASFLPGAALRLLLRPGRARAVLSPRALRAAWFGAFWARAGPRVREAAGARVAPLLEGRVRAGRVLDRPDPDPAREPLRGTVLEVGAGSGLWVGLYGEFVDDALKDPAPATATATATAGPQPRSRRAPGTGRRVTRVLGVEPNGDHHPALRRRVAEARLGPVYEVVPVGVEALASEGRVRAGSVDCVVTTLCLCSIPDPERHIRELYACLRPGGTWYVYEHVRSPHGWGMAVYQALLEFFWPHMIGGCHLQRDTGKWLREAGPWSSIDIAPVADEPWWSVTPHILGTLTK